MRRRIGLMPKQAFSRTFFGILLLAAVLYVFFKKQFFQLWRVIEHNIPLIIAGLVLTLIAYYCLAYLDSRQVKQRKPNKRRGR